MSIQERLRLLLESLFHSTRQLIVKSAALFKQGLATSAKLRDAIGNLSILIILLFGLMTLPPSVIAGHPLDEPYWLGRSANLERVIRGGSDLDWHWRLTSFVESPNPTVAPYFFGLIRRVLGYDSRTVQHLDLGSQIAEPLLFDMRTAIGFVSVIAAWLLCCLVAQHFNIATGLVLALHFALLPFWHESLRSVMAEAPLFWTSTLILITWSIVIHCILSKGSLAIIATTALLGVISGLVLGVKPTGVFLLTGVLTSLVLALWWRRAALTMYFALISIIGICAYGSLVALDPFFWHSPNSALAIMFSRLSVSGAVYLIEGRASGLSPEAAEHFRVVIGSMFTEKQFALMPNWIAIPCLLFGIWNSIKYRYKVRLLWVLLLSTALLFNAVTRSIIWDRYSFFVALGIHLLVSIGAGSLIEHLFGLGTQKNSREDVIPAQQKRLYFKNGTIIAITTCLLACMIIIPLTNELLKTKVSQSLRVQTITPGEPCAMEQAWVALAKRDPLAIDPLNGLTTAEAILDRLPDWQHSATSCGMLSTANTLKTLLRSPAPSVREFSRQRALQIAEQPQIISIDMWRVENSDGSTTVSAAQQDNIILKDAQQAITQVFAPIDGDYLLTIDTDSNSAIVALGVAIDGSNQLSPLIHQGKSASGRRTAKLQLSQGVHSLAIKHTGIAAKDGIETGISDAFKVIDFQKQPEQITLSEQDQPLGNGYNVGGQINTLLAGVYRIQFPSVPGGSAPKLMIDHTVFVASPRPEGYYELVLGLPLGQLNISIDWDIVDLGNLPETDEIQLQLLAWQGLAGDGWRGGVVLEPSTFQKLPHSANNPSIELIADWTAITNNISDPITYWKTNDEYTGLLELNNSSTLTATTEVYLDNAPLAQFEVPPTNGTFIPFKLPTISLLDGKHSMKVNLLNAKSSLEVGRAALWSVPKSVPRIFGRQFSWRPVDRVRVGIEPTGAIDIASGVTISKRSTFSTGWHTIRLLTSGNTPRFLIDGLTLSPQNTSLKQGWMESVYLQWLTEGDSTIDVATTKGSMSLLSIEMVKE